MAIDKTKKTRRGTGRASARLPPEEVRTHCVSVRLNLAERLQLAEKCAEFVMKGGEYLRAAAWGELPNFSRPTIPAINQQAYSELARSAANLNQIAHALNAEQKVEAAEISVMLADFRLSLLGVSK